MSLHPSNSIHNNSSDLAHAHDDIRPTARSKRILRKKHLAKKINCSESTIDNRLNPSSRWYDESFPRPIPLGAGGSRSSAKGWIEYVIDEWLERRMEATQRR